MNDSTNALSNDQEEYQFVRVLGRGAFGEAALYRKAEVSNHFKMLYTIYIRLHL